MLATATHDTAGQFASLWRIYLVVTIAVGALVTLAILVAVVRSRRRKPAGWPRQLRSAPRLEAAYLAVVTAIVIALLAATFRSEDRVDALAGAPAVRIRVTAFQWQWRFAYEGSGVSTAGRSVASARPSYATVVVPAGRPVEFDLRSADVLHSFFIPAMRFKRYAFPNTTNRFVLTFPHPGRMLGECAQFCGWDHAEMRFLVRVLPAAQFRSWLAAKHTGGVE